MTSIPGTTDTTDLTGGSTGTDDLTGTDDRTGKAGTGKAVEITAEPGLPYIDLAREFDASREKVFRAHCDPDLFAKWIGPEQLETTIEHMEARTGGSYRFVQREADGREYAFRGSFHEVTEPSRVVMTFEFEGAPGNVEMDTTTFIALPDGRCRLEVHSTYDSVQARDAMLQSGMETGVVEGYRQLDALLASGVV